MNKVMLVGRLTRDPELRSLPSGKHVATFTVATNEFRGGSGERTEYHPCVAWDRLAEICGQFLSKGQLVDVEGRLQTRQWDDDAGKRHWRFLHAVAQLYALDTCSEQGVDESALSWREIFHGLDASEQD
jgi:single-strand DNA-binding protein